MKILIKIRMIFILGGAYKKNKITGVDDSKIFPDFCNITARF